MPIAFSSQMSFAAPLRASARVRSRFSSAALPNCPVTALAPMAAAMAPGTASEGLPTLLRSQSLTVVGSFATEAMPSVNGFLPLLTADSSPSGRSASLTRLSARFVLTLSRTLSTKGSDIPRFSS